MPSLTFDRSPPAPTHSEAAALAEQNWSANLQALQALQPALALAVQPISSAATWIFARDGSLTAMDDRGQWHCGCSLPLRAAQSMLKSLDEVRGTVACFLNATHAAQIAVALQRLKPNQAIIAIVDDLTSLYIALHCQDFWADLSAHRLFFVAGAERAAALAQLLGDFPGLPIPTTFIRLIITPQHVADPMIAAAQAVFASQTTQRNQRIAEIVQTRGAVKAPRAGAGLCLVAPSHFRLWDDAGQRLADTLSAASIEFARFDPDDPATCSPLALAKAASSCDALIAANFSRADSPQTLHPDIPWITWLTVPAIPAYQTAGPRDHLLLADANWLKLARAAGWPENRIQLAQWPQLKLEHAADASPQLALIADTCPLDCDADRFELSSHRLLWDRMRTELLGNPFILNDVNAYMDVRMRSFGVAHEGLDRALFIDQLIVPAYQQGLARALLAEKLPLRLFGRGWDRIPEFPPHHAGPINTRDQLRSALGASAALIHAWPVAYAHPIDACARPVLRGAARGRAGFIRAARTAVSSTFAVFRASRGTARLIQQREA